MRVVPDDTLSKYKFSKMKIQEPAIDNAPPIGLIPKFIRQEERFLEVGEAIKRYVDVDKPVPAEWVEEFNELVDRLNRKAIKYKKIK